MMTRCRALLDVLSEVPDVRHARGKRYALSAILGLACAAILCGYRSYSAIAEWGRNYGVGLAKALGFRRTQTPCAATLHAVFRTLDIQQLEAKLGAWAQSVVAALSPADRLLVVAIDGKTLCGSAKQGSREGHLLSAVSQGLGITVAQCAVDDKANEITAMPALLEQLLLQGRVVTVDALHTQRRTAEAILRCGADYLMPVKKNQPQLLEDIQTLFDQPKGLTKTMTAFRSFNLGHGRSEHRRLTVSTALVGYSDWPGMQQVYHIERLICTRKTGAQRLEEAYGITSLPPHRADAEDLLEMTRQHWHVENKSHWVRDVTFDEDRSQVRCGHIPEAMAALRNADIGLMRAMGYRETAATCRLFAARPHDALALLGVPPEN